MLKFSAILLNAALMASTVNAALLYVCTSKDFTGECSNFEAGTGGCVALPFNDAVSSIRMNSYTCDFFTNKDCTGAWTTFSWDQWNLRDGTWNDQLTSVRC